MSDIASVSTFRQSEPVLETQTMVRARLTSDQSLAVFRAVLDAASRPGKLVPLPDGVAPGVPPAIVPVLALADLDVSAATLDDADGIPWQSLIRSVTGCRTAAADEADMVVALRPPSPVDVAALRVGTAHAPERGARLFVACRALVEVSMGDATTTIRLSGPGVTDGRTITIDGIGRDVFGALVTANRSFPAGVDTWLVADDGVMVGIPRSTQVEMVEGER